MMYFLWWWYEGRPAARRKNFARGIYYRIEGMKKRRQILREISRLEKPVYQIPENLKEK